MAEYVDDVHGDGVFVAIAMCMDLIFVAQQVVVYVVCGCLLDGKQK